LHLSRTATSSDDFSGLGAYCLGLAAILLVASASPASAWHRLPRGVDGFQRAGYTAVRGVTLGPIECPGKPPCGYGSAFSEQTLDEMYRMGSNWVALTAFGRVWDLESTQIKLDFEASFEENRRDIIAVVKQAHARGMKVLLIPHIFVESSGSKGDQADKWRGESNRQSAAAWARYLKAYREFVLTWANVASSAGVDAYSLGAECKSFSGRFGRYWTSLIADVRRTYAGLLTYNANWWGELEYVIFWDQLDLIGINAFFDMADKNGATYAEYVAKAVQYREQVANLAEVLQMPVIFTELGYTARTDAGVHPWQWPENVKGAAFNPAEQARAYAAAAEAFLSERWFAGFFVWRYGANLDDLQEPIWGFSPHTLPAQTLLQSIFSTLWATDIEQPWLTQEASVYYSALNIPLPKAFTPQAHNPQAWVYQSGVSVGAKAMEVD